MEKAYKQYCLRRNIVFVLAVFLLACTVTAAACQKADFLKRTSQAIVTLQGSVEVASALNRAGKLDNGSYGQVLGFGGDASKTLREVNVWAASLPDDHTTTQADKDRVLKALRDALGHATNLVSQGVFIKDSKGQAEFASYARSARTLIEQIITLVEAVKVREAPAPVTTTAALIEVPARLGEKVYFQRPPQIARANYGF